MKKIMILCMVLGGFSFAATSQTKKEKKPAVITKTVKKQSVVSSPTVKKNEVKSVSKVAQPAKKRPTNQIAPRKSSGTKVVKQNNQIVPKTEDKKKSKGLTQDKIEHAKEKSNGHAHERKNKGKKKKVEKVDM